MRRSPATAHSSAAALTLLLAMAAAPSAEASPRFTVTNETDTKINVYIFTGNDSVCTWEEKLKSVSAGETDHYGCTGNGKGQCKVQFYAKGDEICKSDRNTCNKSAIKAEGGSTFVLSKDGDTYVCTLSE